VATRTTDAVILKFSDRKPIVVTPDDAARTVRFTLLAAVALTGVDAPPLLLPVEVGVVVAAAAVVGA